MISIVATARNDNHGGNLLHRVQLFVNGIFRQAEKHEIQVELILVEWNPPKALRLYEALDWEEINPYCRVRIIEVPPHIHEQTPHAEQFKLHQMFGKNVGIRRAGHDYILATNIDILFPDELFKHFNPAYLKKRILYRTDRFDVKNDIPLNDGIDQQMVYCSQHTTVHYSQPLEDQAASLHFNACGDFQLLDKKSWMELRGYAEFGIYPLHLDTMLQMKAFHKGIREQFMELPACVYHIEHEMSWTPQASESVAKSMTDRQIPVLTRMQALQIAMFEPSQPINDEHWGLGNLDLNEVIITASKKGVHTQTVQRMSVEQEYRAACDFENLCKKAYLKAPVATFNYSHFTQWMNRCNKIQKVNQVDFTSGLDVVVFGTGSGYFQYIKPILNFFGITPIVFIDNNESKHGQILDGVPICGPSKLGSMTRGSYHVIVASTYYKEISLQLIEQGLTEGIDFVNGIIPFYYLINTVQNEEPVRE